eukprot:TRINITY_DN588_c0_g1_i1.p2 TRINITY_DN588_c0_g1~~TRINITY_DN588_c0_g1_i1.p2  ORF type:complete len:114 (+),score=62.54 TRINITY_DN588_c0_g1_i1:41-382(+)
MGEELPRKLPNYFDESFKGQEFLHRYRTIYEGAGKVDQKRVWRGVGIGMGVSLVLYVVGQGFSSWYGGDKSASRTQTREWKEAQAKKDFETNKNAISNHKVGKPAQNNPIKIE